jgi:hypothetical protein
MKTENECRCDKRINQLEEALRNIANGDMRTSRAKAKMALEGTFPPVDEKANKELVGATTPAPTPWSAKSETYWRDQYLFMYEKYHKLMREKSDQAERIRELYAMLGHIVDWSPELPFYIKDEYKVLFRNALSAARELLSKCKAKEDK